MSQYPAAPSFPPSMPGPYLKPHRGAMVLTLGILGIVLCAICGPIAWSMGNNDLREMNAGTMDQTGRGTTEAGRILGMIGTILLGIWALLMLVWLLFAVLAVGAGIAGAAAGQSGGAGP